MKLILTEKPSVAKDIAKAIGSESTKSGYIEVEDYCITWAFGHLVEIDDSMYSGEWNIEELPIIPESFKYKVIKDKVGQFKIIKELINKCDEFIVATDAGREGELIAREIMLLSGYKINNSSYRFWTSEALTKDVVLKELKNKKKLDGYDSLYFSAKARQESDWIVGINLTRLISIKAKSLWTVGRVQTPTLGFIVNRDNEIKNFVPVEYYIIKGIFEKEGIKFKGKLIVFKEEEEYKEKFSNEESGVIIKEIGKELSGIVVMNNKEEKKQSPPLLYSLTHLQRAANKKYGYTAQNTLDIAQKLYETYKCISYPRTDSSYIAESSYDLVKEKLNLFGTKNDVFNIENPVDRPGKRVFNNAKLTDHHALIPLKEYEGSDEKEKNLFEMIKKVFLAAFMDDYIYDSTDVVIKVNDRFFLVNGKKVKNMGWKKLYGEDKEDEEEILPSLNKGDNVKIDNIKKEQNWTKAPLFYNEDTLLTKMEKMNLGTPATRASIIERLILSKYIERDKKKLVSTEKGKELIRILSDSKVKKEDFTQEVETDLENIYVGKKGYSGYREFIFKIEEYIKSEVEKYKEVNIEVKKEEKKCLCGKGVVVKTKIGYKCSCDKFVFNEYFGKKLSEKQVLDLFYGKIIEVKGLKSKTGKNFDAKMKYVENGKVELIFDKK